MQIKINLLDKLTEKVGDKWKNLQQKIIGNLVLDAFREGLIDFDELKELLNFFSDAELMEFFKQNNMLHSQGILNLYATCAFSVISYQLSAFSVVGVVDCFI